MYQTAYKTVINIIPKLFEIVHTSIKHCISLKLSQKLIEIVYWEEPDAPEVDDLPSLPEILITGMVPNQLPFLLSDPGSMVAIQIPNC